MSQPTTLPDGPWESLFRSALTLIDEIRQHGGLADPFFTFGGGTVLMLRYGHRLSKDIDIFVPDPQSLGYVSPRLSDVAEELCRAQYVEAAGYVKLQLEQGEIDFVAAPNLLPAEHAFELWELFGQSVRVETAAEIVAKKMYHRGDKATARDLFDLALVIEREPAAMSMAQPFFYRHMDKFSAHLHTPSASFVRQFNDIATLEYQPTFEHAVKATLQYFNGMKTELSKSAGTALQFANENGYNVEATDVEKGNYVGRLLHTTSHHIVQHLGHDSVALHELHRLPGPLQDAVDESNVHLRYRHGTASLLTKGRSPGHER
ncbi:hypothetical protein E4K72_05915 [Oxalobacteraceae bacterium OM1]|nr:hypothetical protein E4K72_05915 [Oxalobacteraceae bacterium OM1]